LPLLLLPPRSGENCVTGLKLSLGAFAEVLAVLVLDALPAPKAIESLLKALFSSSVFS